jgi:hypothetical protein
VNLSERLIIKTMESPCRTCSQRYQERELCMEGCPRLGAFQDAMVQVQEEKVLWFSTRLRAA